MERARETKKKLSKKYANRQSPPYSIWITKVKETW